MSEALQTTPSCACSRRQPPGCRAPSHFLDRISAPEVKRRLTSSRGHDVACLAPVPEYLAALMRPLDGDRNEHSGEGRKYGTGPTESSSGVDCRGRRRTARVRGEAA